MEANADTPIALLLLGLSVGWVALQVFRRVIGPAIREALKQIRLAQAEAREDRIRLAHNARLRRGK